MSRKRHKPEEIVAKLRQVDVLTSQGQSVAEAVRSIGVTQFTYYRWRQEFGGLKTDQVKRLKELEMENQRLRKAVADLTWTSGSWRRPPGKLLLYSGLMGQLRCVSLGPGVVVGPAEFSLLSGVSHWGRHMMGSEGVGGAI